MKWLFLLHLSFTYYYESMTIPNNNCLTTSLNIIKAGKYKSVYRIIIVKAKKTLKHGYILIINTFRNKIKS